MQGLRKCATALTIAALAGVATVSNADPLKGSVTTGFGDAHWANTELTLNDDGHYSGHIHVYSKSFLTGFTAGAYIQLLDSKGNVLATVGAPSIGVNGEMFGNSDRTKPIDGSIPKEIRDRVTTLRIVNMLTPQDPVRQIKENMGRARDLF